MFFLYSFLLATIPISILRSGHKFSIIFRDSDVLFDISGDIIGWWKTAERVIFGPIEASEFIRVFDAIRPVLFWLNIPNYCVFSQLVPLYWSLRHFNLWLLAYRNPILLVNWLEMVCCLWWFELISSYWRLICRAKQILSPCEVMTIVNCEMRNLRFLINWMVLQSGRVPIRHYTLLAVNIGTLCLVSSVVPFILSERTHYLLWILTINYAH